jgi:hypothetical protein
MGRMGDGGIGSFIKSAFHATPDLIFKLVFQDNSGWVQQQIIAIRREVKYLFLLTQGFGEIISRPTNLHAISLLSKNG